jgi:hypothetical protein
MVPNTVLAVTFLALACFVLAGAAALFGHGLWLRVDRSWNRVALEDARAALYSLMRAPADPVRSPAPGAPVERLRRLPVRLQERLLLSLAPSLDPSAVTPLHGVALEIGVIGRARALSRSRFWWRRLRGGRLLALLGAGAGTMAELLRDAHPAVRAQAVAWAAEDASPEMVAGLVKLLDDPAQASLFTVQDGLLRTGTAAVAPLLVRLQGGERPGTAAALRVAAALAHPCFGPAAIALCRAEDPGVRAGAAELLGATGGFEATDVLCRMLEDGEPAVRAAAARALGRLQSWRCAPELAARLRDTSWQVRRAAGLALRSSGSPGLLLLKKMRSDFNNFAADMARQVLDMPSGVGELRP